MEIMDIIENNPFRMLGVCANASKKDIVANEGKMKAFLKVGREVTFPLDMAGLMPPPVRTTESAAKAMADLALPREKMRHAQFWFVHCNNLDDIAINQLAAGDADKALAIWEKKDCASSLQNRMVCHLVRGDLRQALAAACAIYEPAEGGAPNPRCEELLEAVMGEDRSVSADGLGGQFMDEIVKAFGADKVLAAMPDGAMRQQAAANCAKQTAAAIGDKIEQAKASKGKGPGARLKAGTQLMKDTKVDLARLGELLPTTDLQYQMVADKLGLEILQCGIDYFNDSDEPDAAHKAMKLQSYALSIVVGQMARDRCKENVGILQKIIDNLPPIEVFAEDKAIMEALRKFRQLPDKICHAVTLLNDTKPHLQSIKAKLGSGNAHYLKLSTLVVGNALHNLIEEVNEVQRRATQEIMRSDPLLELSGTSFRKMEALLSIKHVMSEAWDATKIMDGFDMEAKFRTERYNPNRQTLKELYEKSNEAVHTTITSNTHSSSSSDDTNWGCIIIFVIAAIISMIAMCSH